MQVMVHAGTSLCSSFRAEELMSLSVMSLTPLLGLGQRQVPGGAHVLTHAHPPALHAHTPLRGIQALSTLFSAALIKSIQFIMWVWAFSFNTSVFRL